MTPSPGIAPTLAELIALRGEAGRLRLGPHGKVLATRGGGHLSRFRGRGMEFDESRVYQPGDEVRNMDWRVTARAGAPHVKLFREERERPLWLLVDLGPSMRFGTRVAFKSLVAAKAAALLAWAAADQGDRVGGLVFDETRHFERRPAARAQGLLPLLKALAEGPQADARGGHPGITAAVGQLVHLVRPGSLLFLLSDFAGLSPDSGAWLARLGAGCELVLVQIYDPLEMAPPPPGAYPVSDGRRLGWVDTSTASQRAAWYQRFADHRAVLEDLSRRHQAHLLSLSTQEPVGMALARGLGAHPRGGRRANP